LIFLPNFVNLGLYLKAKYKSRRKAMYDLIFDIIQIESESKLYKKEVKKV